jgi:antirestriction protein ArdC
MSRKIQAEVTARIIDQLKNGVIPWRRPWKDGVSSGGSIMPHNAQSGRAYSGINIILLWSAMDARGFTSPRFLTYKQAQALGGNVKRGEKGTGIIFVSHFEKMNEDTGKIEKLPFLKYYTVFNIDQCENLNLTEKTFKPLNKDERNEMAEQFISSTGAKIVYGGNRACFVPSMDKINMPAFEQFKDADSFYHTHFHELIHWTGTKERCNREFGKRFGDKAYTAEELVAELGASFICAEFGIDQETQDASYIASWIKFLESHESAIITAASAASKAVDFLRGEALKDRDESEELTDAA